MSKENKINGKPSFKVNYTLVYIAGIALIANVILIFQATDAPGLQWKMEQWSQFGEGLGLTVAMVTLCSLVYLIVTLNNQIEQAIKMDESNKEFISQQKNFLEKIVSNQNENLESIKNLEVLNSYVNSEKDDLDKLNGIPKKLERLEKLKKYISHNLESEKETLNELKENLKGVKQEFNDLTKSDEEVVKQHGSYNPIYTSRARNNINRELTETNRINFEIREKAFSVQKLEHELESINSEIQELQAQENTSNLLISQKKWHLYNAKYQMLLLNDTIVNKLSDSMSLKKSEDKCSVSDKLNIIRTKIALTEGNIPVCAVLNDHILKQLRGYEKEESRTEYLQSIHCFDQYLKWFNMAFDDNNSAQSIIEEIEKHYNK